MNKTLKIVFLFFTISILAGCGYSPLNSSANFNFYISDLKVDGDRQINNYISKNLKKYRSFKDNSKKIDLNINSKYRKDIVNKDSAGNAKNYKITISSNITFTLNGNEQVSKVFERYAAFSSKSKKIDEGELVIETKEKLSKLISEDIVFFIINQ